MTILTSLLAVAAAQLAVGGVVLKPADFLDGRAIAGGTGTPVVMLTLGRKAAARLKTAGPKPAVTLDGKPAVARIGDNTIEIDGQATFDDAGKLALAITGKPPLPDSLDE